MANEIRKKFRTKFTAQAAGTYVVDATPLTGSSGGATTLCDLTYDGGSENVLGADLLQLVLNVTAAPATTAAAEIWYRGSTDTAQTDVTNWKYSHTVGEDIDTTAKSYDAGIFDANFPVIELSAAGTLYVFSGNLVAIPILPEVQ